MRSGAWALTGVDAFEEGLGFRRRRGSQPGGERFATAPVGELHLSRAAQAMAGDHEALARILRAWFNGEHPGGPYTICQPQRTRMKNRSDWMPLTNGLVLTNGTLLLLAPDSTNYPARFYRIIEH